MEILSLSPPDEHAIYFKTFIKSLIRKFQPQQLFCFARKSVSEETNGCFIDAVTHHNCHYCLLIITETPTRIDHEVQEFANVHYKQGVVTILCHGKETILEAIKANNRFIPTQAGVKARKQLSHRMPLVEGFLMGAHECFVNHQYRVCTFMLHQAVEQCCIVLIRVHMAYRSEIHNLKRLLSLCNCFSNQPFKTLLSGSSEDERLFNILIKSYSEARYNDHFFVEFEDSRQLYDKVTAFVSLARTMCKEKIQELENEAVLYKKVRQESEVMNG